MRRLKYNHNLTTESLNCYYTALSVSIAVLNVLLIPHRDRLRMQQPTQYQLCQRRNFWLIVSSTY